MGLEVGTFIDDLVITNPTTTDKRREGDDHFRLIKSVLKNTFPNADGAINPTVAEFNFLVGVTALIQDQLDAKYGVAGAGLTGAADTVDVGAGLGIVVNADDVQIELSGLAAIEGNALNTSEDGFLVNDDGVPKLMSYTDSGLVIVTDVTTARTLVTADINTYIEMDNAAAIAVTVDTGFGKKGNVILIEQFGAGRVTVGGTATINNANGLRTKKQFSVIVLTCKGGDVWTLAGDAII